MKNVDVKFTSKRSTQGVSGDGVTQTSYTILNLSYAYFVLSCAVFYQSLAYRAYHFLIDKFDPT